MITKDVPGREITWQSAEGADVANSGRIEFRDAGMLDTRIGASDKKDDPAKVARDGWDAAMKGEARVVSGWKNKVQAAAAHIAPPSLMAEQHRKMAAPGTAEND